MASLTDLKAYALTELCAANTWDRAATQLEVVSLRHASGPCGLLLRGLGPKRLWAHAIWSVPDRRLLFYNTAGQRVREIHLSAAPELGTPS